MQPKIWFIADTHFEDGNAIKHDKRPFDDLEDMETTMILIWNSFVKPEDTVYHLGDFALGTTEKQKEIFKRLKGKKILIKGNHDATTKKCKEIGWDEVHDQLSIKLGDLSVVLIHNPALLRSSDYCIHGHTHMHLGMDGYTCVSCNLWGYAPISEEELLEHIKERSNEK